MKRKLKVLLLAREKCAYSEDVAKILESDSRISLTKYMTENFFEMMPADILAWRGDYMFSFRSPTVVPQSLLDRSAVAAVNFHPGPVDYPGSGAGSWALLEGATSFGVTAHLMEAKVDSGPVLAAESFPINGSENHIRLLKRTHETLHRLAVQVIPEILAGGEAYLDQCLRAHENLKWANNRRRMDSLNKLRSVHIDVDPKELDLLVRALHSEDRPLRMIHHGYEFVLRGIPEIHAGEVQTSF